MHTSTRGILQRYIYIYIYILVQYIYIFIHTDRTPPRKDTGVFESIGRFIGLKCHNYALYLCFVINNPIRGNIHTLHCHGICYI